MQTLWLQGRVITPEDLDWIRSLIGAHAEWGRTQLSIHIAQQWNWCNAAGRLKDMAARTLLLKLEARQLLALPARQQLRGGSRPALVAPIDQLRLWDEPPIQESLSQLRPLQVKLAEGVSERRLVARLLSQYHYLGYGRAVGENLQYLAWDRNGRPVACAVFGAAAWKCAVRDRYIGWEPSARQSNLFLVAQQYAPAGPPLGPGQALGLTLSRNFGGNSECGLATQIRSSDLPAGEFRGSEPL